VRRGGRSVASDAAGATAEDGGGDGDHGEVRASSSSVAAPLAPPGGELSTGLRCYRYTPGTSSLPHYDKSSQSGAGGGVSTHKSSSGPDLHNSERGPLFSAYSVVLYLNGDDYAGGATSFYEPISRGGGTTGGGGGGVGSSAANASAASASAGAGAASSRRGLTWAVGGGSAPLYRIVARVYGGTGDALFFPHGHRGPAAHPNPLHEGSPVVGHTPKYIIRSDLMFAAPGPAAGAGAGKR
jgi:hypothetical protein